MIWPDVGYIVAVARRGEYNWMWSEEGNKMDVARRG